MLVAQTSIQTNLMRSRPLTRERFFCRGVLSFIIYKEIRLWFIKSGAEIGRTVSKEVLNLPDLKLSN
jgi:hypothetical protein